MPTENVTEVELTKHPLIETNKTLILFTCDKIRLKRNDNRI